MSKTQSPSPQLGFTLIELMVVIVIISILASLIVMNISGVDQRKAMQAREVLMMDLRQINREANDQARILALIPQAATDVAPFQYRFDEYQTTDMQAATLDGQQALQNSHHVANPSVAKPTWKPIANKAVQSLPDHVSFVVESQSHDFDRANNAELLGNNAPRLIWFGNGEAKPVSIQMYYDQKPIGELIQVDYLGKIIDES